MKKIALLLIITLLALDGFSQREALYSQYMYNQMILNAGYAASRNTLSATLLNRIQWINFGEGAPRTYTLSFQMPLKNERMGVGMYVYADQAGPVKDIEAMANYAYAVRLGEGMLSMGLQAGITSTGINYSMLKLEDKSEDLARFASNYKPAFDANVGLYYYTHNWYVGVSSKHLLESRYGLVEKEGKTTYGRLARHFYAMAGVAIPLNDYVVFRPGGILRYATNSPVNYDLNASFLLNDQIWLGASYRSSFYAFERRNSVVFMSQLNLGKNFRIGYAHDVSLNATKDLHRGVHEFMLTYELFSGNKRLISPRYF